MITTNLRFADWTQLSEVPPLTAALLGRLTQRVHIIMPNRDSYRLRESVKEKSPANRARHEGYIFLT